LAATIGFAIFVAIDAQSVLNRLSISLPSRSPQLNATDQVENQRTVAKERDGSTTNPDDAVRLGIADVRLPSEYGAYAVLNGKLTELGLLPIKVQIPAGCFAQLGGAAAPNLAEMELDGSINELSFSVTEVLGHQLSISLIAIGQ
jgi:hypothetical protein